MWVHKQELTTRAIPRPDSPGSVWPLDREDGRRAARAACAPNVSSSFSKMTKLLSRAPLSLRIALTPPRLCPTVAAAVHGCFSRCFEHYSARRARTGSSLEAAQAGTRHAAHAT